MKLVCESLQELFESPDEISLPHLTYNRFGEPINQDLFKSPHFDDDDALPFWYDDGVFHLGAAGTTHPGDVRKEGFFSGRVWTDKKLISFWEYPDAEDFLILIDDLEKELGQPILGKRWKVEVLNDGPWKGRDDGFQTELVPVKDYKGSEQRSQEDLGKEHIKSPLFKAKHVAQGFGSKNPNYQSKRAWQMASATSEGVADKYASRHFGIPDPEEEFNRDYAIQKYGKPALKVKNVPIYKNPKSLDGFDKGVRGVVDKDGNLYLALIQEGIIHDNILDGLKSSNIISSGTRGWDDPEKFDQYDFVTVQRIWGKNKFAIGESYALPKPKFEEERVKALKIFEPFMVKAKKTNPQFEWVLEQVRVVARKTLSPEEYEEFKTQGSGA